MGELRSKNIVYKVIYEMLFLTQESLDGFLSVGDLSTGLPGVSDPSDPFFGSLNFSQKKSKWKSDKPEYSDLGHVLHESTRGLN